MEDHTTTDSTPRILQHLRADVPSVGCSVQAALRRTQDDARSLATSGSRVRLTKGGYREPAELAHEPAADVDAAYVSALEVLMHSDARFLVATHDPALVAAAIRLAREAARPLASFEVQMLYGIRPAEQRRLVAEGLDVRVYVAGGVEWYGYVCAASQNGPLTWACSCAPWSPGAEAMMSASAALLVLNARIFDWAHEDLVEGVIRIGAGRIVEIGKVSRSDLPTLDAAGSVVTPGLIDCHFHACGISLDLLELEGSRRSYVALKGAARLARALRRGFTTVGDPAGCDIGIARAIDEGLVAAPNYFYSGAALSQTGGHGDYRPAYLHLEGITAIDRATRAGVLVSFDSDLMAASRANSCGGWMSSTRCRGPRSSCGVQPRAMPQSWATTDTGGHHRRGR